MTDTVVTVPLLDSATEPPAPERIRRLKRHLIESLRALRVARHPKRLVRPVAAPPEGFVALVTRTACATCRGHCCKGGGEHAYIDERTMARVRHAYPDLNAGAIIRLFLDRVAPESYRGSCLFHGPMGCTLGRGLRADLCDGYYCDGLREFLRQTTAPDRVRVIATRGGQTRRSRVLTPKPD
jgi:hypothetical protein